MKILMLTHRVPWPLQSGDRIRTFHFFNYLAERHEVALLSFAGSPAGVAQYQQHLHVRAKKIEIIPMDYRWARVKGAAALVSGGPISVRAFYSEKYESAFQKLVEEFKPDYVFTDSSALAQYPLKMKLPFVADFMDVDSEKWRQIALFSKWPLSAVYKMESRRLARFEKEVAQAAKVVFVVSESEKARLSAVDPEARICVIPNGVERNIFYPTEKKAIPGRLVFIGVMNYFPNVDAVRWFCREIWPRVLKKVPQATFYIVGANPSRAVRALKRLPGVEVTGSVLDIRPYMSQAEVCVAPLRFAIGLQNKVIQSLAMGKAIVSTTGAVQGLAHDAHEVVKVINEPKMFAENVAEFLLDENKRKKFEKVGPAFVAKYHDWGTNLQVLREYF